MDLQPAADPYNVVCRGGGALVFEVSSTPGGYVNPIHGFHISRGVLDFGLDGGVPPGPRDPNPCLEVKKVPMFRDFAQKMDPCLGIF